MTTTPTPSPFTEDPAAIPDKILVIGSGFAGFWAVVAARRVAGARAEVTLGSYDFLNARDGWLSQIRLSRFLKAI